MNKGFWYILGSAVLLGMFGVFITHLAGYFSVYEQVILRSIIALLCCLVVALWHRESFSLANNTISKSWFTVFLIAFPLSLIFFTTSVTASNATVSIFLLYVGSLISTFVMGRIFFGETMSTIHRTSLALCLIGIIIFSQLWSFDTQLLYLVPGLVAGFLEGCVHSARRGIGGGLARSVLLLYQHATSVVLCLIVGFSLGSFHEFSYFTTIPLAVWLYGIVFGLLLCLMSWLLLQGFRQYDVNKGTVLLSTELLFALVFNLLLLSIVPTSYELMGGAMIAVASVLPILVKQKE